MILAFLGHFRVGFNLRLGFLHFWPSKVRQKIKLGPEPPADPINAPS